MYDIIKKQNGEAFARGIRRFDNGIFDVPNLDKVVRYAGRNPVPILGFLESLKGVEIDETVEYYDPFLLLKSVGYNAFYADSLEKQNSIQYLYAKGEELCTFNDRKRFENYHIIHCVKEGAFLLNREDFKEPKREDEYGTSVLSIQILKTGGYISIKNRYNHSVDACDNTFSSNPDNIVYGLSFALKKYLNVDFASSKVNIPTGYSYQNGQIFKFDLEKNNAYFGSDFCLYNGKVYPINKDCQIFVGPYLLDMREKRFLSDFPTKDFFSSDDLNTIDILNQEVDGKKISIQVKGIDRYILADEQVLVQFKNNKVEALNIYQQKNIEMADFKDFKWISSFSAPYATKVHLDASYFNFLKKCSFPEASDVLIYTASPNLRLRRVDVPKVAMLKVLTPEFFCSLEDINTPSMAKNGFYMVAGVTIDVNKKECLGISYGGSGFKELINDELKQSENLSVILDGKDKKVLSDGIVILETKGSFLKKINFEKATVVPEDALSNLVHVEEILLPNAIIMQDGNICNCPRLRKVDFSNLMYMDNECFNYNDKLEELNLVSLQEMGINSITTNQSLKRLNLSSLKKLPDKSVLNNQELVSIDVPNLENVGLFCFNWLKNLEQICMPKVVKIGPCCFQNSPKMTTFDAPELLYLGDRCFIYPEFKSLYAPKLEERWREEYLPFLVSLNGNSKHICSQNERFSFAQKSHGRTNE